MRHYIAPSLIALTLGCSSDSKEVRADSYLKLTNLPSDTATVEVLLRAKGDAKFSSTFHEVTGDTVSLLLSYGSYSIGMRAYNSESGLVASTIEGDESCDFRSIEVNSPSESISLPICANEDAIPAPEKGVVEIEADLHGFQEALTCQGTETQHKITGYDFHKLSVGKTEGDETLYRFYYSKIDQEEVYYIDMVPGEDYDLVEEENGKYHLDIMKRNDVWRLRFGYGRASLMALSNCQLSINESEFGFII